jgi:hypothetical protein
MNKVSTYRCFLNADWADRADFTDIDIILL